MSGGDANAPGGPGRSSGERPEASALRAAGALRGTKFGDVRWVASTGSTNADVLALARQGEPEGIVVVADHQRAGRGRRGRTWTAPPGGSLLCSVLLRPPAAVAGLVTMAVGVAAVEALDAWGVPGVQLKWPNDLVVVGGGSSHERKLAGILAEADWPAGSGVADGWRTPSASERVALVVGMGLNVNWPDPSGGGEPPELAELAETAVAVNQLTGEEVVDRVGLLVAVLHRLDVRYRELVTAGSERLLAAWRAHAATLGRTVRIELGADDVVGTAIDVTGEGHLVVETVEGDRRTIAVGDVVHLRPA
ncbi:MAG TPA: biotin--[acetyl-CoA-carboxylase] ligase [Acidimicrobiales bacterium]|nr:biotin--[acetyl-CoA-carboxylase] ligase [Acidimicrobiales bacterium]